MKYIANVGLNHNAFTETFVQVFQIVCINLCFCFLNTWIGKGVLCFDIKEIPVSTTASFLLIFLNIFLCFDQPQVSLDEIKQYFF